MALLLWSGICTRHTGEHMGHGTGEHRPSQSVMLRIIHVHRNSVGSRAHGITSWHRDCCGIYREMDEASSLGYRSATKRRELQCCRAPGPSGVGVPRHYVGHAASSYYWAVVMPESSPLVASSSRKDRRWTALSLAQLLALEHIRQLPQAEVPATYQPLEVLVLSDCKPGISHISSKVSAPYAYVPPCPSVPFALNPSQSPPAPVPRC